MIKPRKLNAEQLQDWMRNTWNLYAARWINGKTLQLTVNHLIEYRVLYGDVMLYEGTEMVRALDAWDNAS